MRRTVLLLCCLVMTGCATLPHAHEKVVVRVTVRDNKMLSESELNDSHAISNLVRVLSTPERSWHLSWNPPWSMRFTDFTLYLRDGSAVTMGTAANYIICGNYSRKITDTQRKKLYTILYPQQAESTVPVKAAPSASSPVR